MSAAPFGFGIVGTGMIAGVITEAIAQAPDQLRLAAVSSRRLAGAQQFIDSRPALTAGAVAVEGLESLLSRGDVQGVYIATPTVAKEAIALAAIAAGKHVLVEKPYVDLASLERMTGAAAARGVLFMDATHFVHHPRTAAIQTAGREKTGPPRSLHTAFYFPNSDRENIRFDVTQEPMTALGDMAWYSMRAVVEYLRPAGAVTQATVTPEYDEKTGAIIRASGLAAFTGGEVSTFDIGYTAGTVLMDLQLLGTTGVISMDDFVLDWTNSWHFKNPEIQTGYFLRQGLGTRQDFQLVGTPSAVPQEVLMVRNFAELAAHPASARARAFPEATRQTQALLDALWHAIPRAG